MHHDDHDTAPASLTQLTDAYWLSTPPSLHTHQPCPRCAPAPQTQVAVPRTVVCRHARTVMTAVSVLTVVGAVLAIAR
ncbi:hypothetical protein V2W30_00260 [Streptomyces sp. Q6]|uniref:Uncharacterized protein n=1 Tax=Streptomyces citrinus TaxID=3118173 RepID=A0ACD5A528_9ACTN